MANRFARKIRAGEIETEEALKSEFKTLAKELHPDIAGVEFHAEFVKVREEYENALRDFDRHRFGASGKASGGGNRAEAASRGREDPFIELGMLLKRGFPKRPIHEKEKLRYGYALWRFRNAIRAFGDECARSFDAFERELLALKEDGEAGRISGILEDLVAYRLKPISPLRTAIELDFEGVRAEGLLGTEADAFLGRLVAELGDGRVLR